MLGPCRVLTGSLPCSYWVPAVLFSSRLAKWFRNDCANFHAYYITCKGNRKWGWRDSIFNLCIDIFFWFLLQRKKSHIYQQNEWSYRGRVNCSKYQIKNPKKLPIYRLHVSQLAVQYRNCITTLLNQNHIRLIFNQEYGRSFINFDILSFLLNHLAYFIIRITILVFSDLKTLFDKILKFWYGRQTEMLQKRPVYRWKKWHYIQQTWLRVKQPLHRKCTRILLHRFGNKRRLLNIHSCWSQF